MILLHDQKIAIMTLPKCATNTLHAALRRKKWNGETYVGYSTLGSNTYDRHVNIWPHEVRRYKKVITVRNPYNRLVSLYLHYATRETGHGRKSPNFTKFVEDVAGDSTDLEKWYKWNLTQWLDNVEYDHLLKTETLKQDLEDIGLIVKNLPFLNKNYRAQMYKDFFTPELMQTIFPWTNPDCQNFQYPHEVAVADAWN